MYNTYNDLLASSLHSPPSSTTNPSSHSVQFAFPSAPTLQTLQFDGQSTEERGRGRRGGGGGRGRGRGEGEGEGGGEGRGGREGVGKDMKFGYT